MPSHSLTFIAYSVDENAVEDEFYLNYIMGMVVSASMFQCVTDTPKFNRKLRMKIEEEYEHIRQARLGNQKSIDKLVSENDGIIRKYIVKLKLNGNYSYDDAYQDGVIGVLEAIRTFNLESGFRLSTWTTQWCKATIYRQMLYNDATIKRPADYMQQIKVEGFIPFRINSIDEEVNENGDAFVDIFEDPTLLEDLVSNEQFEALRMAIAALPETQEAILMHQMEGKTFEEIGELLGLDKKQVAYQRKKAIEEIRWKLKVWES